MINCEPWQDLLSPGAVKVVEEYKLDQRIKKLFLGEKMSRIKGVIFDLDGTLINTLEAYAQAFNRGIKAFDLEPISKEKLATLLNQAMGLEEILLKVSPYTFEKEEARRRCIDEIREAYLKLEKEGVLLIPCAKEVLSSLKKKGLKIGIVTGRTTPGEMKWLELRRLEIAQFIDAMVTGAEAQRKPAPDGIIKCLEELGLSVEEGVFVGDAQADIIAGKRARIRVIAVSTGVASKKTLATEEPNMIIDNLTQLYAKVQELAE